MLSSSPAGLRKLIAEETEKWARWSSSQVLNHTDPSPIFRNARWAKRSTRRARSTNCRILPAAKFAFLGGNLILFVSRAPDAVTDHAVGLGELPDNPVLTTDLATCRYRQAQSNRLADFELTHRCLPLKSIR
jgi:hypothetical protein